MKKIISFALLVFTAQLVFSQTPMKGTYTIGAPTWVRNYNTFTDAVNALTTNGVSGKVTFDIYPGRYYEQIEIPSITGASSKNRITFQSLTHDTNSVCLVYCPKYDSNYVVLLKGADYLTFRDMTFTPDTSICSNHTAYKNIIVLSDTNYGLEFIGNRFIGALNPYEGDLIQNKTEHVEEISIIDNSFYFGKSGIYLEKLNKIVTIVNNRVYKQKYNNVVCVAEKLLFKGNHIISNSENCVIGAYMDSEISENFILNSSEYGDFYIHHDKSKGGFLNVFNNYIKSRSTGMEVAGESINIFHNTIISNHNISLDHLSSLKISGLFYLSSHINVYNNILLNLSSGHAYFEHNNLSGNVTHNNNLYYGLLTKNNSKKLDLQSFQTQTGQDQNSAYFIPSFEADSMHTQDLRLRMGKPLSQYVPRDIDGEKRDGLLPFVGCDEFKPVNIGSEQIDLCIGDTVRLAIDSSLYGYQWSTGDTSYYTSMNDTNFFGDTLITVSAIKSNTRFYDTVLVRVHNLYADAGPDTALCSMSPLELIGKGNASMAWNNTYFGDTFNVIVDDTMEVVLKVYNEHGCYAYDTMMINGWAKPWADFPETYRACDYENYKIQAPSQPNVTYVWKRNALPDTFGTDSFFYVSQSALYTLIMKSNFGCMTTKTQEVEIKVSPKMPDVFFVPNDSFCLGDSIYAYLNETDGSYFWNGQQSNDTGKYISSTTNLEVTVRYRGCHSDTNRHLVVENPKMQKPIIVSDNNLKGCQGDSLMLTTATKYARYNWNNGLKEDTIYLHSNGLLKVKVWDAVGCESPYSDLALINFYPKPLRPKITSSNGNNFCEGDSTLLTGPGGYLYYVWSGNGIDTTDQRVAKSGGGYYLRVVDTNFCTSDASNKYSIALKPAPPVPQIQGDTILCLGTGLELMAIPNNLDKYYWDDGDTNRTRTLTSGGAFKVKAIGNNLCESEYSELHTVTEKQRPNKPTVESIGNDSLRSSLTAASYNWYLDNTSLNKHTRSILAMTTGDYEVALFEGGCESERSDVLYFIPSGIDENQEEAVIKVYPNPGKGLFFIETPIKYQGHMLRVYDMHGSLIKSATIQNTKQEVDLGDVAKGIYLVKVGGERIVLVVE